ncbi:MAG: heavy metal-binding domain-containing protein [Ferruginibacter sp.]
MAILTIFCITTVNAQIKKDSTAKHQHTMAYQCPMKCEGDKTYDKAGKCPKCGMSLAVIEKPVAADIYKCPMKCEGDKTYDKAGKCPVCGMSLKNVKSKKAATKEAPMKM